MNCIQFKFKYIYFTMVLVSEGFTLILKNTIPSSKLTPLLSGEYTKGTLQTGGYESRKDSTALFIGKDPSEMA